MRACVACRYEQKAGEGFVVDPSTAIKYSKIINEFMRASLQWRMDTMGVVSAAPTPRRADVSEW